MIGILIVCHGTLASSLAAAVTHVLGSRPAQFETLSVGAKDDPSQLLPKAREIVQSLDTGEGVLVFSDIYGAMTLLHHVSRRVGDRRVDIVIIERT